MKSRLATTLSITLPIGLLLGSLALPAAAEPGISGQAGVQADGRAGGTAGSLSGQGKINADILQPGASDLSIDKTNVNRKTTDQDLHEEAITRTEKHKRGASKAAGEKQRETGKPGYAEPLRP